MNKKHNPFTDNLVIHYRTLQVEGAEIMVETAQHFRVYTNSAIRFILFKELSIYARDYLSAIQHFTHPKYKYVIITYEKMCKLYGKHVSPKRYETTIRELIKMSIIDCLDKSNGKYWYNPLYFSPGSRIRLFPDNLVKYSSNLELEGPDWVENLPESP